MARYRPRKTRAVLRPRSLPAWTTTVERGVRRLRRGPLPCEWRGEFRELLSDDSHLLDVAVVCGQETHFVPHARAQSPTGRRLSERYANSF